MFFEDILFYNDKQIFFLFDTTNNPITCHFISGNNGEVGLPIKNEFTAKELLDYIESDNISFFMYIVTILSTSYILYEVIILFFQYTDLVSYQHLIIY